MADKYVSVIAVEGCLRRADRPKGGPATPFDRRQRPSDGQLWCGANRLQVVVWPDDRQLVAMGIGRGRYVFVARGAGRGAVRPAVRHPDARDCDGRGRASIEARLMLADAYLMGRWCWL